VHFRTVAPVRKNKCVFCTECELVGKDHQLAFDRYKVSSLELSLGAGYLEDDDRYSALMRAIDAARAECDMAVSALLVHWRSHDEARANVIVMPCRVVSDWAG
jgi:hypothetical protein